MNLKSYLRGIGIGILVTSAVFIISGASNKQGTMTDDMVKARAKELGMVEAATTVADVGNASSSDAVVENEEAYDALQPVAPTIEVVENAGEEQPEPETPAEEVKPTEEAEPAAESEAANETDLTPTSTPVPTKEVESQKEAAPTKAVEEKAGDSASDSEADNVVIVINAGDGSDTAARKLAQAGLIDDAAAFDKFLISKGYDRKITTGNHVILKSATQDEIADNLISSTR